MTESNNIQWGALCPTLIRVSGRHVCSQSCRGSDSNMNNSNNIDIIISIIVHNNKIISNGAHCVRHSHVFYGDAYSQPCRGSDIMINNNNDNVK